MRVLTIKQLNRYIAGVFDDEIILHDICVTGEIFEFKISQNNTFIVLKEDDNVLECYKYGQLERFSEGAKVEVRGKIKFYPKGGRVSLTISDIKLTGEGQFHLELQKLKERLAQKGYFDNKTPLPVFVKKVALITSLEGAVLHDFASVIQNGHNYIDVEVVGAAVQGDQAQTEITSAIQKVNQSMDVDVIVIARGGGSYQDLLPFNTEQIATAVFESRLPIISAVGHETDYTLCDFCSSFRAPTPSLAAEQIAKINQSYLDRMLWLLNRAGDLMQERLERNTNYVLQLSRRLSHKNELAINTLERKITAHLNSMKANLDKKLIYKRASIETKTTALHSSAVSIYSNCRQRFCTLEARLDSLSPLKLLAGGYAKVISDGKTIKSAAQTTKGSEVKVVLFDGIIKAKVTDIEIKE